MANPQWNDQEIAILLKMRPCCSTAEISKALALEGYDRTAKAISRKAEKLGVKYSYKGKPEYDDDALADALEDVLKQRQDNSPIQTMKGQGREKFKVSKEEKALAIEWMQSLLDVQNELSLDYEQYETPIISSKQTASVVLSDWHFGRFFKDHNGNYLYNIDIAKQRVITLGNNLVSFLRKHKDIDEVVFMLLGDIADGSGIFKTQSEESDLTPLYQVHHAVESIWNTIMLVYNAFPNKIIRIVSALGNHGRVEGSVITNWDNIVYQEVDLLTKLFNKQNKTRPISFIANFTQEYNITTIKGHRVLLRHIAPVQADTASAKAKFAGWNMIHDYSLVIYGHWHHVGYFTYNGCHMVRNGSLVGGDPFAESLALYDDPQQTIIISNEEHIVKSIHLLEVE